MFALLLVTGLASAQVPTSGNVFFGYSYENTGSSASFFGSNDRPSLNGWEASFEGKVFPLLGIVADFDSHYGTQNISTFCEVLLGCTPGHTSVGVTERDFLFGPRVSISVGKFRPFAEALFGASHISTGTSAALIDFGSQSDTSFATALGGGLDYKIIRPIAWRFQGDYIHTSFFGAGQNNVRFSTGIVVRF
jgi:opacity protein-like surface antigen